VDVERIGNYRIDGERRRDASGIVYEARHLVLPRRAIIKVMDGSEPRPLAVQLLREACILEALEHPGIIRVFESGLLADRRPWFAHERIDGATVADLLQTAPLDPAHAVILLRDIADVLEHAHRRGIIHCGLAPDTIVITGRARGYPLCIVDWSAARVHDTTAALPVPRDATFAAPELRGACGTAQVDDRADVFSLGVMAYHALTGQLPVFGAVAGSDSQRHMPTEVHCPEAPPELTGLVDQMLAWERWDRPSSAEAHVALEQLARDHVGTPSGRAARGSAGALAEPGAPGVRIRRPQWTPTLHLGEGEPELTGFAELDDAADDNAGKSS
jgi:serine/threonine protein kinase